jgi:hypothetical protein
MATLSSEAHEDGNASAKDRYPMFETWLRKSFVHVTNNPRIMKAFWKWSDFVEDANTRLIFKYGTPPLIDYVTQACDYFPDGTPSGVLYGITFGPRRINLNTLLLDLFEDMLNSYANPFIPARLVIRKSIAVEQAVQLTILHEMIHWSYYVNGEKDEAKIHGGDHEYGTQRFELEAYGHSTALPRELLCGRKSFSYLGLNWDTLSEYSAERGYNLYKLKIKGVDPDGPAAKAGIQPGDEILQFAGDDIAMPEPRSGQGFDKQLQGKKPGDKVTIKIRRSYNIIMVDVVLGTRPVDK